MPAAGDIGVAGVRRPSVAGANTQLLLNLGGVEGASPNLTFNVASNTLNTFAINAASNIAAGNLSAANANVSGIANLSGLISPNTTTYANGTIVVASANHNFNNTATVNVALTANGSQVNIALTTNAAAILSGVASGNTSNINVVLESNGQIQIDTRLTAGGGGTPAGPNQAIQFNNNSTFGGVSNLSYDYSTGTLTVTVDGNMGYSGLSIKSPDNRATLDPIYISFDDTTGTRGILGFVVTGPSAEHFFIRPNDATANIILQPGGGGTTGTLTVGVNTVSTANANITNYGVFQNGSPSIQGIANLNFNNTATVVWTITANGANQANVSAASIGSAPGAGGNTTEIQFNLSGALDGTPNATYLLASNTMVIGNNLNTSNLLVTSLANVANLVLANGTMANPSLSFGASRGTGLYMPAANVLGITSNGNLVVAVAQTSVNINTSVYVEGTVWASGNVGNAASFDDLAMTGVVYAATLRLLPHMGQPIF